MACILETLNSSTKARSDQYKKVYDQYRDEMASAFLKDLDYDDTSAGRDYLKRLGYV